VESLGPLHAFLRFQEPSSSKWLEVLFQRPRLSAINYKVRIFIFQQFGNLAATEKDFSQSQELRTPKTMPAILKMTFFDKVNKPLLERAEFTPKGISKKTSSLPLTFNSK
jgi:hypothetical protein